VVAAVLLYGHLSYDLIGNLPADAPSVAGTRVLREHFPAGILGPVDVLLVSPLVDFGGRAGRDLVSRLTRRLRDAKVAMGLAEVRADSQIYVAGPTASVRDLEAVVRQDRGRIEVLVLAGVFVILLLLLRQVLVSVYLLLSVLFSYYATLGVTFAVFWLLDPH